MCVYVSYKTCDCHVLKSLHPNCAYQANTHEALLPPGLKRVREGEEIYHDSQGREQQLRPDLSLGSFIWDRMTLAVLEFKLGKVS